MKINQSVAIPNFTTFAASNHHPMFLDILIAMLWSISPFGEAKLGIPYALLNDINIYLAFVLCFSANVLVFPIMSFFLDVVNRYFMKWKSYKKAAIFVGRRAKAGAGNNVKKYGFWGLMIFVLIPLPGTGVYAGSIAGYLFGLDRKKAFLANTAGIFFSCVIVWVTTVVAMGGFN
ncbi:COG2426 family protein [Algoriphagus sp.]|uniref:COG2426 family protein n=1 Tax=Algoriphagus sp. TaxID=1872435 RepID=UPI00391A6F66